MCVVNKTFKHGSYQGIINSYNYSSCPGITKSTLSVFISNISTHVRQKWHNLHKLPLNKYQVLDKQTTRKDFITWSDKCF